MLLDPWKTLDLKPTKDKQQIERAWRKLASKYHPDHGGDAEKFKQLRAAYEQALAKSKSVIEVVTVATTIPVSVTLGSHEVLDPQYLTIQFKHKNQLVECEVLVPEWQTDWGQKKTLLVRTNDSVNLMINIELKNELLEWNGVELIWRPALELLPVLESGKIIANWNHRDINIDVDTSGHGVLLSQGYKNSEGVRANVMVRPNYIWPKIKTL